MTEFQKLYKEKIVADLKKQFNYSSVMQVPKLEKITLNVGLGEAVADKKIIKNAIEELGLITGQKAVQTLARKSEAGFKIREGWPIGAKVTLRGKRMYDFLQRLVCITIPRIRDFRGVNPKSFDGRGNFNMGIQEQIVFPEIDYDKIDALRGLNISITTSAKTNEEAHALLTGFNFPFKERG